jgi:hypothetical protein
MLRKTGWLFPALFLSILLSGCPPAALLIGGAAGGGAVAFVGGELKSTEEVSLNRAWGAAKKAMDDLEFAITSEEKDAFYGQFTARGAGDKKIKVKLKKQSDTVTEIRIRVGIFGDESLSRQILDTIKKRF